MLSWHELPRASFDLETTGRDPHEARIVTASIILVDAGGAILKHHEWLVDPGVDIPEEAAAIHGISTERARADGIAAQVGIAEIIRVLQDTFASGVPVLAFNAAYDFTVLAREAERFGLAAPEPFPVIDPFIMDKQTDRYRRGKRTLTAMAEHYGVAFENAHTSAADVMATLAVGAAMAGTYPVLAQDAASLHRLQTGWAAEQAASFQSYLRRRDPEAVIDGTWPVKPAPAASILTPAPAVPMPAPVPASGGSAPSDGTPGGSTAVPAVLSAQPDPEAAPPAAAPAAEFAEPALFALPAESPAVPAGVQLAEEPDGQLALDLDTFAPA
ncbi:3'-5' exonuclease [Arthrobacter sp. Sa2CUA1]|uniref:3'-5' exonuclease n=1 Tax=Arthrobacter gallicola TaxID=2762225 RepID=A0ABR8US52_9MICC|nr:3'-5' exonuclease [Arthrobacter gallicola]MBD7995334.1 3'-5' exonuclease [Arthrobacter gallicola]